jgi:hypothetical protein
VYIPFCHIPPPGGGEAVSYSTIADKAELQFYNLINSEGEVVCTKYSGRWMSLVEY